MRNFRSVLDVFGLGFPVIGAFVLALWLGFVVLGAALLVLSWSLGRGGDQ